MVGISGKCVESEGRRTIRREETEMAEAYAFYQGTFGQAIVLEARSNLVAHSHSESQIAFWLGGARAQAHVGAEIIEYGENVGLATNAYQSHDMTLVGENGSAVFLLLMISRDWLNERRKVTGRPFIFPSSRVPIDELLRRECWKVLDLILTARNSNVEMANEVEQLILATIDAATHSKEASNVRMLPPLLDHRLRAAIALMREYVRGGITLDEIIIKIGLSRAHFFALFKEQLHTTPQIFWSAVRVEEAMRRLINQGESLTDVALDLGFSAPSNFSRFFKEHIGVSPSVYRRAAMGTLPIKVTGLLP
jgi:AraC-like DNA-binding protein